MLRVALALRLLVAADGRSCSLVAHAFAVVVRLVEHHDVAMLTRAHAHAAVRVSHVLVQRVASRPSSASRCPSGHSRLIEMLKIRDVRARLAGL